MKHQLTQTAEKPGRWTQFQCSLCRRGFRILAGTHASFPDDCEGKPANNPRILESSAPLIEAGPVPTIPIRGVKYQTSHQGVCATKPLEYDVTVALPCLDHAEETAVCVALLRAQTVKPYFLLVDTGSRPEELARIEAMRSHDLEVHRIAANGTRYASDLVAYALDLCFSRADTPYVFTTHQDCFVRRRDFLEYLIREIEGPPARAVVGWQLTPRFHADWRLHFGHTAALFDMAEWDRIGATWTLRRAMRDGKKADVDPEHKGTGVWPDTESTMNTCLLRSGVKTTFLGTEENGQRNKDEWIDHCRSLVCGSLYCPERHERAKAEMVDAKREARERLAEWRGERPRQNVIETLAGAQIDARKAVCDRCPQRGTADLAGRGKAWYCALDLESERCNGCVTRAVGAWQTRVCGSPPRCEKWP